MNDKTTLIIVRHCESTGNVERIFCGLTDAGVTENGVRQLDFLAERMRCQKLDAIYTSPLIRAKKTAQAVNRHHGLPVYEEDGLKEINGGCWEGEVWESLPQKFPIDAYNWNLSPKDFAPKDGESMADCYARVWRSARKIARRHQGGMVCAVSHGCAIRNLLCRAEFGDISRLLEVEWCDNTAVSVIEFDENFRPSVVLKNDSSHLTDDYSTIKKQNWWKKENIENLVFE